DITERKRAEVAVRESQQRFQGLVETLIDWIWEIDAEGFYTYVSPQVEDLLGYEPEEVIGKTIFEFSSPEDATRVKSELEALMAQKLPVMGMQGEYVRQDGYVVVFESNAQAFYTDDGTFLGYRGTHRDVTDRREVEKEREKLLKDLESRASQLQTAAEVGQAATSVLDLEELLPLAVNLIRERFDYYYVGAFMVDDSGQWAVLRAGTGAAGEKMLESGHHLAVGGDSMIGACIQSSEARLAFDVGEEAIRFDNPLLPETRSEMALPLIGHGESLGALTIQSSRPADFSSADIIVLQTMADQLANAIYNVTLLQQREEAFKEIERAYGSYTRESWRSYLERSRGAMGFRYRNLGVEPATAQHPEATSALRSGLRVVARAGDLEVGAAGGALAVPIQLRGQTLGVLNLRFEEEDVPPDIVELVEDVANRLGLALDSARLLEQTRISAAREQLISEATSRMRETLDMEAVLKTAAQEVRNALGVPEVVIRLGLDEISTYKPGGLDDL
ncbi:MAG: PAS domain S-box protein, partial [Anaerolineae bacterium]|nr:PAS domain S-box protein [Anaerolineae bacterium]